ncbi:MAG TPA: hypothetical protein VGL89_16625 [Candidatus Koribacter sp.]|jgi:hypothetical protein
MELITGITGAAARPDGEARPTPEELEQVAPVEASEPEQAAKSAKPEPGLTERSYSLVGRAMRAVMKTLTPLAWQSVVQKMAERLPAKITLEPAPNLRWDRAALHGQFVEELGDQGFSDVGEFFVKAMQTKMQLMVNEAYDIRAVIYEHENSGIVLDLVTLFGDGTGITYVNRKDPGIEQSPLHPNIYLGDVPVFELLDYCLRERPKKARIPETPLAAVRLMELEYEFGTKRLKGETVNPVEIADIYLDAIEQAAVQAAEKELAEDEPVVEVELGMDEAESEETVLAPKWTGRPQAVLPPLDEVIGLTHAEHKKEEDSAKAMTAGKKS